MTGAEGGAPAGERGTLLDVVRAFGVMLGGSIVLNVAAGASVVAVARAGVRGRRPHPLAIAGVAGDWPVCA